MAPSASRATEAARAIEAAVDAVFTARSVKPADIGGACYDVCSNNAWDFCVAQSWMGGTPQQFAQFVQREFEKWRVVVRESGAVAE